MKVLVTGSRDWPDDGSVMADLKALGVALQEVICGGAQGADEDAAGAAVSLGLKLTVVLPDYALYAPRVAPLVRNQKMVDMAPDLVLAYWRNWSGGTADCVRRATLAGLEVRVRTL